MRCAKIKEERSRARSRAARDKEKRERVNRWMASVRMRARGYAVAVYFGMSANALSFPNDSNTVPLLLLLSLTRWYRTDPLRYLDSVVPANFHPVNDIQIALCFIVLRNLLLPFSYLSQERSLLKRGKCLASDKRFRTLRRCLPRAPATLFSSLLSTTASLIPLHCS